MSKDKYPLPACLVGRCDEKRFTKWLNGRTQAHVRRDNKRARKSDATAAKYKQEIYDAVCSGGLRDPYTGEELDWSLVGKYNNSEAKAGGQQYKRKFGLLPTVDHTFDELREQKLVICSWKVNDAKSDLTLDEFHNLCEMVLDHRGKK